MFNFSKLSSLAIALTLVGGVGLSNAASAKSAPAQAAHQLAEGGSDRLIQNRVAEGGSDRLIENRVAEGGSDRLIENHVAEGGADRLQELRERSAV
ncbi:phage infection protein [Pseudomonas sp. 3JA]|uniref:phage infection protein n=1 Tax=Pseudomonas sp. 3JA TaxID=3109347 RepID=UPI00300AABBF